MASLLFAGQSLAYAAVTGASRARAEQVGQTIAFRGLPTAPPLLT